MKYALFIYETEQAMQAGPAPGVMDRHYAVAEEAIKRNAYVTCDALQDGANGARVRVRDGETLRSDGPFTESKEIVGGFYMLDCRDMDEAVEFAAQIPHSEHGWIEVRPIAKIPGWDDRIAEFRANHSSARV
jgi:hypothetical protein